jgi:NTE family protein
MVERRQTGRRVALVVGAGSVKCAAALGLWRVLQREGIEVDLFVGCSGGSLYTAAMALGYDLPRCEEMTGGLWTREITETRDWRSLLSAVLPGLFGFPGHFSLISDRPLDRALKVPFGDRTFADVRTPLHIVATDYLTGERVVVSQGLIRDAVRASVAIPYIWPPHRVEGRLLLDGCMSDPLPVDVAMREGADLILAMAFESPSPRRIRSALRYAFQVNTIYTNNLLRANYAFHNLAHHAEIIPVIPEFDERVGLFDTAKIPYVIRQGEKATEAQLPFITKLLETAIA